MGGLRGLGRLGGLGQVRRVGQMRRVGQVGVRAAPAIVGQVGQVRRVGGRAERAFVRYLFFAYPSLILRLTFGERLCDLEV